MMILSWLPAILLAYVFFSFSSLGDKLVLSNKIKPGLYTFYIGMLSGLVVILIPFIPFTFPTPATIPWIIAEAVTALLSLYIMFKALETFEVSRVMPTIGAFQPVFIVIASWVVWGPQILENKDFLAFLLLFSGSVVISMEKKPHLTFYFLALAIASSLMFSLDYIFSKMVFLQEPFLQGLIWMRICTFALAVFFLLGRRFRAQLFAKSARETNRAGTWLVVAQASGGVGYFLQSLAISAAPVAYLAIVNSLRGVQYVFLFALTLFFSSFFPTILHEQVSPRIVIQKIVSILLIMAGLAILVL